MKNNWDGLTEADLHKMRKLKVKQLISARESRNTIRERNILVELEIIEKKLNENKKW